MMNIDSSMFFCLKNSHKNDYFQAANPAADEAAAGSADIDAPEKLMPVTRIYTMPTQRSIMFSTY
jgi:hypothetical protein